MSNPLSDLPLDLRNHLVQLRNLSPYGVLAVECSEGAPLYIWRGVRSKALAATARVTHGIHTEEDEGTEELEEDDENDERQFDLFAPIPPSLGQYL